MDESPGSASRRAFVAATATLASGAVVATLPHAGTGTAWASPTVRSAIGVPRAAASQPEVPVEFLQWRPNVLASGEQRAVLAVTRSGDSRIVRTSLFFGVGDDPREMTGAPRTGIALLSSPDGGTGSIDAGSTTPLLWNGWLAPDGVERRFEVGFTPEAGSDSVVTAYLALWYYDADTSDDLAFSDGRLDQVRVLG
jgi:hypothetical protein